MLVHAEFGSTALEKFILDKCKTSVHFALQVRPISISDIIHQVVFDISFFFVLFFWKLIAWIFGIFRFLVLVGCCVD
jgi:hypothetical protein